MALPPPLLRAWRSFAVAALQGARPAPFAGPDPEAMAAFADTLAGWAPFARGEDAQAKLASRAVEQLARLHGTRDRHPDNPRNDPRLQGDAHDALAAWTPEEREARFGALERAGDPAALRKRVREAAEERAGAWERAWLLDAIADISREERRRQQALGRIGRAIGAGVDLLALGADWSAGFLEERALAALEETAARLEASPALREILVQLGRLAEAEAALREEARPARPRAAPTSELRGVRPGGALERLTPAALAHLGSSETEGLFLLGLLERRLPSWDLEGPSAPRRPVRRRRQAGPLAVCVDTSASMDGAAEALAKATVLACLRLALRQGRRCTLVSFSSALDWQALDISRAEGLPGLLGFLLGSFRGGTEPGAAIRRVAATRGLDLLLVTDGRFDPAELAAGVEALHAVGARGFGLLIGDEDLAENMAALDAVWRCDADGAGLVRCLRALADPPTSLD